MPKSVKPKKYAQYVSELEVVVPPGRLKMRHISVCDSSVLPASPYHVEAITWTGVGSAFGGKSPSTRTEDNKEIPGMIHYAFDLQPELRYPMYHTYDEVFMFVGTNPKDPRDLGGEIELWLGAGEHAEKWVINKTTYVYIPAGLVHGPMDCVKFERPFIEFVFAPRPAHVEHQINLWPPGYKEPFKR
jgi:hypothetical protein